MHLHRSSILPVGVSVAAVLALVSSASGTLPAFEALGDLAGGTFHSDAQAVSADGSTVVGRSVSSSDPGSFEAFRWTSAGGMTGLGDLGPAFLDSQARGVSGDGLVVVGEATPDSVSYLVPFRWSPGTGMEALLDSSGAAVRGQAFEVSNDGTVVVGVARLSGPNEAFRWTAGTGMAGLGWLPGTLQDSFAFGTSGDGSVVCGISFSGPGSDVETFRWTEATEMVGMGDVPGGLFYAIAWDVSDDGSTIVGDARASSSSDEMFVWRPETGFELPDSLHGATFSSSVVAVSANGAVAVGAGEGGAMIWDRVHGMRNLAGLLVDDLSVDLTGWQLTGAVGVSADGRTIAGNGINPDGDREAWIARLPAALVGAPPTTGGPRLALAPSGSNPFSSWTAFRLDVPSGGRWVRATVHGVSGRVVRTLVDAPLSAGSHSLVWDGRDDAGRPAGSGVFFLLVEAGGKRWTGKMVLRR